ncbi:MAG: exo-alpha-sialidase [Planctomycetes bacterium]|nr:exo-alpha-sialidase [Planctomycetota bacterium]
MNSTQMWRGMPFALIGTVCSAQIPDHAVLLNPTAPLDSIRIARSGPELHAVGRTPAGFIHYARSVDGGRTWPVRELPLAWAQALGDVVTDGPDVHIAVSVWWAGPFVISSRDRGATWTPGVRVSQDSNSMTAPEPRLHQAGQVLNVVWREQRAGGAVWANRSTDGGRTWQAQDQQLGPGAATALITEPIVVALGAEMHVFWARLTAPPATLYQRSIDGGATWLPAPRELSPVPLLRAVGDLNLLLVVDTDGQIRRSNDRGITWSAVGGHGITHVADLAITGPHVLLVGRRGTSLPNDVLLQSSNDGGDSWLAVPYSVPQWRSVAVTARTTIDAGFVHFAFTSDQLPLPGVVIQTDDFGAHWRLLDGDAGRGLWTAPDGALVLAKTGANGTDVRAWVLEGHTHAGVGSAGGGGHVPWLVGGRLAGIGRRFFLVIGGAPGGSVGGLFTSFQPLVDQPFGGARLYLQQPIVTTPLLTNGGVGVPAVGMAEVLIAVPNDPAIAGQVLRSQAFVLDPTVGDGYVATPALESWVR